VGESEGLLWGTAWRVVRRLSTSDLAEIVLAERGDSGDQAHVKVMRLDAVEDLQTPEGRRAVGDRVRLEHDALRALRTERVPAIRDFGLTPDGRPYFATEIIEGAEALSLRLAERGALSVAETVSILLDVLGALEAAHDKGIIHREVKTASLLTRGGRAWLTDFGIAKVIASSDARVVEPLKSPTTAGTKLGSPRFLSPEQALGKPVDARTDVYQVGLVAFECLTGVGPFDDQAADRSTFIKAHAFGLTPRVSSRSKQSIPPSLDDLIAKALDKVPSKRFASAAEMAAALRAVPPVADPEATALQPAADLERMLADEPSLQRSLPKTEDELLPRDLVPAPRVEIRSDTSASAEHGPAAGHTSARGVPGWVVLVAGVLLGAFLLWALQRGLAP